MIIESKEDLILISQGLIKIYSFHLKGEEIETEVIRLNPEKTGEFSKSCLSYHKTKKERTKKLLDAINTNLENLKTAEKAAS